MTPTDNAAAAEAQNTDPTNADVNAPEVSTARSGSTKVNLADASLDGEVTFTIPGVEAKTFQASKGTVSVSADNADWLEQHTGALRAE